MSGLFGLSAPQLLARPRGRVLGAAPGTAPNDVVLTIASRGVFVHDVLTQSCRCNWAVSPGTALSGNVVVHPHARRYTVVVERQALCGWHEEDREFGTSRLKLDAPVHSLVRLGPHLTAAVHADGSTTLVDAQLTQRAPALALAAAGGSCACVWAASVEGDLADPAASARRAGGELLLMLTEGSATAAAALTAAGGAARKGGARGGSNATSTAGVGEGMQLRLHILRVGRAGPVAAGPVDDSIADSAAEPGALPLLELLTAAEGIRVDAPAAGAKGSAGGARCTLASAAVSVADGADGSAPERALRLLVCWSDGRTSEFAIHLATGRAEPLSGGGAELPSGASAVLALGAPYYCLVSLRAVDADSGADAGGGSGGSGGGGGALDVSVREYRHGTQQFTRSIGLQPLAGLAAELGNGDGGDGGNVCEAAGGGRAAKRARGVGVGGAVVAAAGGARLQALALSADGGALVLCCDELVLSVRLRLPPLSLARLLAAAPSPYAGAIVVGTGAGAVAEAAAAAGDALGGLALLARGWAPVEMRLSSADLLDSVVMPTAVPTASLRQWEASMAAAADAEAAALGRAREALSALAAARGPNAAVSTRELESILTVALSGCAAPVLKKGSGAAKARAAGAATHGDSAAAAAHPLALLSSAAAHRLLRHGCISHAGTHTARALARSLLQRNSISAAACPELLPAILPTAADADDDGSALDALAAFVSRAADIAESELVSVVRVLLPRARAERLLACQAVAAHAGAPTDRPTAVAAAAAAAAADPAEAAGGARNARARACVLLARVCVCAKSDEPLLDALADLRVDEATELIAQLTGMMRQHAARWNVENTAASAGKGAGKGADDDDDDADGAAATARPSRRPLPSLRQLADWACALLDAQLVALALHADSHAHVRALATLVGKHVRLNEAVRKLHGYLAQILESAATPSAAAPVPEYCVEVAKW